METKNHEASLKSFYRDRIAAKGFGYEAMWGDAREWKSAVRYEPLKSLPISSGDRLVDIGCGIGNLYGYLQEFLAPDIHYVGIEAVAEFAAEARRQTHQPILELDAFSHPEQLPDADWYVCFGAMNKDWCIEALPGASAEEKIFSLVETLFAKARKGVALSLVTDVVDYKKPDVANVAPFDFGKRLTGLTPFVMVYHGYPFYEFFSAAWRSERG
jgi:SAM-dependent methyltransferase